MSRTIIHIDLDAFFCSVEEQRDPTLRGKAFAVGGRPSQRGVVASCSYEARRFGVRSAMSMARALAICPQLQIVSSNFGDYRAASQSVMARLSAVTPLIEQISIDEAFLDVSAQIPEGMEGAAGFALAYRLQREIREELNLPCSIGVASNKLVAKIATDHGKLLASAGKGQSPQAIHVVPPGEEAEFLAPLPVNVLWGVGPKTAAQLQHLGINTIGKLAQWSQEDLIRRYGRHGFSLSQHARGIDKRDIETSRETKSISTETTFENDIADRENLLEILADQAAQVARQLQKHELQGTTVRLKLRWPDFVTPSRQATLPYPTQEEAVIRETATYLFERLWPEDQPVRLLGVGISGLSPVHQLSLWDAINEEANATIAHLQEVKDTEDVELTLTDETLDLLDPTHQTEAIPIIEELVAVPQPPPESTKLDAPNRKQQNILSAIERLRTRFGDDVVQRGADVHRDETT
jgi:DNA polymerase-4